MPNTIFIILIVLSIVLFFWSIIKAIRTQKSSYSWGMLPFFVTIGVMLIR